MAEGFIDYIDWQDFRNWRQDQEEIPLREMRVSWDRQNPLIDNSETEFR
jgi:hypothetical protein